MTPVRAPDSSTVAILLCTFNGEAFLREQLASIAAQTHEHWSVWASDDGSVDGTLATLARVQRTWPDGALVVRQGPARGLEANFASLIARSEIDAPFFAFCDQDDVWEPTKLERAVAWLTRAGAGTPALYGSRTRLIDERGHPRGLSPRFSRPPSFRNAITQNIAGGNTMVFNAAARQLLMRAADAGCEPVTYDWWTYLLVAGAGGQVFYDPEPTVRYRQHGRNQVGANTDARDRVANAREALAGRLRRWNDVNLAALDRVRPLLTDDARAVIDTLRRARRRSFAGRVADVWRSGIERQTMAGTIGLWIAAAAGRL